MLVIVLCSCAGQFGPFIDRRRNAGVDDPSKLYVGESKPERPAICYSSWNSTPEEILELAEKECAKIGKKATYIGQTKYTCRAFMPHHAYYECK